MAIYFDGRKQRWIVEISRRVKNGNGEVVRLRRRKTMPHGATQEQALAISTRMDAHETTRAHAVDGDAGWDAYVAALLADQKSWLYKTLTAAKTRARTANVSCGLAPRDLAALLLRSKGRCEVTGLRFSTEGVEGSRTRPYLHSIDRIKPSEGYEANNVRIVCFAVNMAMSDWGEEVFAELARGYVFNRYSAINFMRHGSGGQELLHAGTSRDASHES